MPSLLLVMIGGAIGAGLRYEAGRAALRLFGPGFPWGTLFVNLAGGLAIGLLAGWLARHGGADGPTRLFLGLGVLGGFTTFSAFSLELHNMVERGQLALAFLYATGSVLGSVLALVAGLVLVRAAS